MVLLKPVPLPGEGLLYAFSEIPRGTLRLEGGLSRPELRPDHQPFGPEEVGVLKNRLEKSREKADRKEPVTEDEVLELYANLVGEGAPELPEPPTTLIELTTHDLDKVKLQKESDESQGVLSLPRDLLSKVPHRNGRFVEGGALEAALGSQNWVRMENSDSYFLVRAEDKKGSSPWNTKNGAIEVWKRPWSPARQRVAYYPQTEKDQILLYEDLLSLGCSGGFNSVR
jgi:hypothetical protein